MDSIGRLIIYLPFLVLILLAFAGTNVCQDERNETRNSCSTEDLRHSLLIECKSQSCPAAGRKSEPIWPQDRSHIIHMYSTRSGERFAVKSLRNLDYVETNSAKMLDINATLYIDTSKKFNQILGFGTRLDATDVITRMREDSIGITHTPLMRDFYSPQPVGIGLTFLRLTLTQEDFEKHDIAEVVLKLDQLILDGLRGTLDTDSTKVNLILSFDRLDSSAHVFNNLERLATTFKSAKVLSLWAISLHQNSVIKGEPRLDMHVLVYIRKVFKIDRIFAQVDNERLPSFSHFNHENNKYFRGVLMKSNYSSVYNILDYASEQHETIISLASDFPKTSNLGDWQNSQHIAVEILNNLKHGSQGFIEDFSPFKDEISPFGFDSSTSKGQFDRSIYSFLQEKEGDQVHLRGPMFYAIGHFSRYISPESHRVEIKVATSPNMFAAHYISFLTKGDKYLVALVLNNNEHMMPFRISVNDRITTNTMLDSKSFNTFVIKQ